MRFQLNQFYVFFAFQVRFESGHVIEKAHAFPTTSMNDEIIDIKFIRAECIEHHKVGWDQDPKGEKKYDGFIFRREEDGALGHNQYPAASYGQMSDSGDRQLNFLNHYFEKHNKDVDAIVLENVYLDFTLFTGHIENLEMAIYKWTHDPKLNVDTAYLENLKLRKAMFLDALKAQLNMGVRFEQFAMQKTDGTVIKPEGFYTAALYELDK